MKKLYITVLFILGTYFSNAQINISGVILDSLSKEPLPNASIFVEELNRGAISDLEGKFIFKNLPIGKYTLKISYISYLDKYISINSKIDLIFNEILLNPSSELCLHQVVITAGVYSTQDETAIKIETLNKKDIEGFGGVSLIKDLSRIPGIDAVSKGNGIATPIIRGLSTNNILVLNNGVKMQNFQFSTNHPYMIDEFGVEKIEVVKGPASLLFGSNAVGGALNLIKESPALKGRIKSDINLNYNSNTKGLVGNVGIKVTPKNVFYGIRTGIKSHKDYIDGTNKIVPNSRFNEKSLKLFSGINKKNITSKLYIDYNIMKLGLTIPPILKLGLKDNRKNDFWYQDLSNLLLSTKNIIYSGKFRTEIDLNYQINNRKLFENPNSVIDYNTVDMLLKTLTYEVKTTKSFGTHKFVIAIQGLNQNNKNADVPEHVLPNFKLYDFAALGLFQLNFKKKIHTQFGLRYDIRLIDIPIQENIHNKINKSYNNLSYSIGSTFDLTKHFLLRTNFASGYRTPSIAELSQDGSHGNRYEIGDPNLLPQRNYEGDLSFHIHSHKIKLELSSFYNSINNYIYLSPTKDKTQSGLPIFKFKQTNAHIYGIESNVGYFPTTWLNLNLAYNYLIAKKENNNYLPLIPQNKLRGYLSISNFINNKILKNLSIDIEGTHAFEQNYFDPAETYSPSFDVFNIGIANTLKILNQKTKFSIKINNVFNSNYIDHISTLKDLNYNEIGRNINIGLKIILDKKL